MKPRLEQLKEKIKTFPTASGVYVMKNQKKHIIYVGKAKNIRNRVRQYFTDHDTRYQIRFLMDRVHDIDFLQTNTENEALLLENSLIKKHKPKYNVFLKDDKTYLGLKLTIQDDYPRLLETRRIKKDGSVYYGPFTNSEKMREVKEFIDRYFLLRTCSEHEFKNRTRPCLEYQIKRCSAPCVGYVDKNDYQKQIHTTRMFLEGKSRKLQNIVKAQMKKASEELNFEEAAHFRNLLSHMEMILEKQNVTQLSFDFLDVLTFKRYENKIAIAVLMVRDSQLIDSKYFTFLALEDDEDFLQNFIAQYYSENAFIPKEILLPLQLTDKEILENLLAERAKSKITIRLPQKGEKKDLLHLAEQNLHSHFQKSEKQERERIKILKNLQKKLHLSQTPFLIECYDNSHISGQNAVSSLILFRDGEPDKKGYKKFKIQTQQQGNDYGMMYEILKRRFTKKDTKWAVPDLILIDGGKSQLSAAMKVLAELDVHNIDIVAIAKGSGDGARAKGLWENKKEEDIYLPNRKNPVKFQRGSPELMLLQKIRDEAHRFAITYHRQLREKELTKSWLDTVPGIGPKKKQALLQKFGSPKALANASIAEITTIPGITKETAQKIHEMVISKELQF